MNTLVEKIKSIFKRKEKPKMTELEKERLNNTIWGTNDISRSIRESNKFQTQKNLWRRIFHF